ncbi:MAG: SUMF1/EgtB/PvdO family nonheme iron enzyme [Bacteroidota bacterium]
MQRVSIVAYFLLTHTVHGQFTPPGTVKVEAIYVDATEITNLNYLEYLHYLKLDSTDQQYVKALPDTTVWSGIYDDPLASAFVYDYFRGTEFRNFPVVGISRQQATDYCEWRSAAVNQKLDTTSFRVKYYLPSPDEWYSAALSSSSYQITPEPVDLNRMKFLTDDLNEIKKRSQTNLSRAKLRKELIGFYERNPILLFENLSSSEEFEFKNYLGVGGGPKRSLPGRNVNNIRGNISELTSEPYIAMGGNWTLTFEETVPELQLTYQEPSALIGFRCFCQLVAQ